MNDNNNIEILNDNNQIQPNNNQPMNNQQPINNQPTNNNKHKKHAVIVVLITALIALACTQVIFMLNNKPKEKEVKEEVNSKTDTIVDDRNHTEYELTYKIGKDYKASDKNNGSWNWYTNSKDPKHYKHVHMRIDYFYSYDGFDEFSSIKSSEKSVKNAGYVNVSLSDLKTEKINGNKYQYYILEYTHNTTKETSYKASYVYKIDVDRYYYVEYEGFSKPNKEDLKFLDISVKKVSK